MTERERWIVYPLLFLALGSALRDKLIDQTRSKSIVCQELTVFGEDRTRRQMVPLVRIGAAENPNGDSRPIGAIEVDGVVQAELMSANDFYIRGLPLVPNLLKALASMLPPDWLNALQQSSPTVKPSGKPNNRPPGGAAAPQESSTRTSNPTAPVSDSATSEESTAL